MFAGQMLKEKESENSGDCQTTDILTELKRFCSGGRGFWKDVSQQDWEDWRWQLRNRITRLEELKKLLRLTPKEEAGVLLAGNRLALAITPYFFNLIDREDENCPIRRQVIPTIEETHIAPWEKADPCGEEEDSPTPGIVHRYPDRVLFLVTDRCASYCRYCTRSRMVSNASGYDFHLNIERQIAYVREHKEVRDVLLSGGDPLLLNDEKIEELLRKLRQIPHVELLRIGTRIPIFLPQRITDELCGILKKYHPLFISIHTNHPKELTIESRAALERLANAGIPLGNQSVLLKGVNDDLVVMKALVQKLIMCRVKPYYLYQCDLVAGTDHLRASIKKGIEIMLGLRGFTTGYAIPQYVIDAPRGGGKIPIKPNYILNVTDERIVLRNYEGKIYEYPEVATEQVKKSARGEIYHDLV
ncbi:MAG: KamA family radical SAM protein [Verrucomicrobiia bacterium]